MYFKCVKVFGFFFSLFCFLSVLFCFVCLLFDFEKVVLSQFI